MAAHHQGAAELDSGTDSVTSTPRSIHKGPPGGNDEHHLQAPRIRLMCSFGEKILPRPHDNQLRYVDGDTRIVAVNRSTTFAALVGKLSKLSGAVAGEFAIKTARLRLFLFPNTDSKDSRQGSRRSGFGSGLGRPSAVAIPGRRGGDGGLDREVGKFDFFCSRNREEEP